MARFSRTNRQDVPRAALGPGQVVEDVESFDGEVGSPATDQALIDRCLEGEVAAWEQLYHVHHGPLCTSIKAILGGPQSDPELVDEIAAMVWYALVAKDGALLGRFELGAARG